jgi:hypothetical protein
MRRIVIEIEEKEIEPYDALEEVGELLFNKKWVIQAYLDM